MNENARSLNLIRTILLKSNKRVLSLYYPTILPHFFSDFDFCSHLGIREEKKGVLYIYFYYFDYVKI